MTTANTTLRALMVYALALPVALLVGYQLASVDPARDLATWATVGLILLVLSLPLLLKWYHPLLFLSWNATVMFFFLPGRPQLWFVLSILGLVIAILQRSLVREMRFIHAPSVTAPLIVLVLVVLITGKLTGGFGTNALGSENVGGGAYYWMFAAAAGAFAMIAHRVPPEKALPYVGLFFLGGLTNAFSTMAPYISPKLYFIFMIFPVNGADLGVLASNSLFSEGGSRYYGLSIAAMGAFYYVLARHGAKGLFGTRNLGRLLLVVILIGLGAGGGFRSFFILMALTFFCLFYFEGLMRTKYAVTVVAGLVLCATFLVPLADRLPLPIQRSLSFLPIEVDAGERLNAQESTEWRVNMWKRVLYEEAPQHFWLGKGLELSGLDLGLTSELASHGQVRSDELAFLTGAYHNGPLTVLVTFGIWGALAWFWFLGASLRALYFNYLYGDEALKKINTFLLALFAAKTIHYMLVFGDFRSDFAPFVGLIGFGLALNGGIRKPVRAARFAPPINLRLRPSARPVPALSHSS